MKIAYAFALVGTSIDTQHAIAHLTAIQLFLLTKPRFEIISVQTDWSGNVKPVGRTTNDRMEQNPLKMYQSMHEIVTQRYNE